MTASSRAPKKLFWLDLNTTGKLKYRQKGGGKFTSLPAALARQDELIEQGVESTLYSSGPLTWTPLHVPGNHQIPTFTPEQKVNIEAIVELYGRLWSNKARESGAFTGRLAQLLVDHDLHPDPAIKKGHAVETVTSDEIREVIRKLHHSAYAQWVKPVRTKDTHPRGLNYRFRHYFAESVVTAGYILF